MTLSCIDTHCHLTFPDLFADWRRVVDEAHQAGVERMITVACRVEEASRALEMHAQEPSVFVAAGIHPHEAGRIGESEVAALSAIWKQPGIVAAGEMGLDYHYDFSPREVQRRVFEQQLEMAASTNLPLVIHCREAQAELIPLLEKHGYRDRRVVFHCFSGTAAEAAEIRSFGWRTSFTGLITFKNTAGPQQACADTPLDQLMFETDAPYLAPEPVRKMRPNAPRNLPHTIAFAAMLRGTTVDEIARISTQNALQFYGLAPASP